MRLDSKIRVERGIDFLAKRLRRCHLGWERGMARRGYRDEPEEGIPFTEKEEHLMANVQAWRIRAHEYEDALYQMRDARIGMLEGLALREVATEYISD